MLLKEKLPLPLPTFGDEMAQYRPQAQTAMSDISDIKTTPVVSKTVKPPLLMLTTASKISTTPLTETKATLAPVVSQATPQTEVPTGELTENTPPTDRVSPKQDAAVTTTTTTTTCAYYYTGGCENVPKIIESTQQNGTVREEYNQHNCTVIKAREHLLPYHRCCASHTTKVQPHLPDGHPEEPLHSPGTPHQAPHSTFYPAPSPSVNPSPNSTLLYWGDLSRTLAFAWELHVYGSASLFLLLFAGAALGLTLSPATNCPHRGALALANALLFLAGGLRAALFLIDPYGTRKLIPRPAVTALYNLPLHLLVWTHAALALLALRVAGVSVLPSTMERPPLVAVLAVLQCTLLLAADMLSPALSPVVPVTLQVLSLCWGLAICLGFLCYVFPHVRCPPVPHPGVPEEARRKAWTGSKRIGVILGRVLAVCAVVGALCCGLHVHATLWLYGLLGDWTHFNWGWWLVHFWARLLELAWGSPSYSWVLGCSGGLKVAGEQRRVDQIAEEQETCRPRANLKSDSNGVGGGGGPGEVPNNWAGQERPGADISKSLIRNQNHEQSTAQPRCVKDSNRGRNHRGHSAERGIFHGSTGSLLRLQALGRPPQRSVSGSLDQERDTSLSLYEFDLRPPSPIDLTRSIDEALHREHLLEGGSLFHPLNQISQSPSPGSGVSQGPWLRRNSDPQMLSESSEAPTESSMPLGGSVLSSVPSRQNLNRESGEDGVDDTRPFITPDSERVRGRSGKPVGSRSYLEVSRHDDSASVS
ncbi:hypothetical protein INR49_009555, partial [Caranx melampygus]